MDINRQQVSQNWHLIMIIKVK